MKVLAYCPIVLDGTAYWRATAPLSNLRQQAQDLEITFAEKCDYRMLLEHDVLFLQRPFTAEGVAAAQLANTLGRPVWCDWDDDILNVPSNNGRVFVYQQDHFKQNVKSLLAGADAISVTNKELAKRFAPFSATKPVIIPNALDPLLTLPSTNDELLPVRRVVWRGGDSHNEDLLMFGDAFPRVARETEGRALWHFIGFNPHWLLSAFPASSVSVHQWIGDVVAYLRFLGQLTPSFVAVPLVDSPFNRCKSNISVIEASWAGAVPIAPRWLDGCDLPGVLTYDDKPTFEAQLTHAVNMSEDERLARLQVLREAVAKSYSLTEINKLRALVLKRITTKTEKANG